MAKVLLIGLDGATFDVIHPLIAAGKLPNLARLMQSGAWGPLRSAIPPITPTAWTSVFTGKNPGKHGIYDFQELDPATYQRRPVHTDRHQEKPLWALLDEAGKRSIIIDVPFTYPPQPLNGLMITGYGTPRTPDTRFTYPGDFKNYLPPALHSEIRVGLPQHRFDRSQALIDEWRQVMDGRNRLLQHLIRHEAWDFFFAVLTITDNMGHIFWTYVDPNHPNYHKTEGAHFREAFFDAYAQCDTILGDLLSRVGSDTTTLVMSDHGFGSIYPRQYLFQRLLDGGYLAYQAKARAGGLHGRLLKMAVRTYNGLPFLREWVKGLRPQNKRAFTQTLQKAGFVPGAKGIDHTRSQVLPTEFGLQLWLNSSDRFANGPVPAAAKADLQAELSAYLLAEVETQSGQPIIAAVHRGKEVYSGETAVARPDLIIEYNNFFQPGAARTHLNPKLEGGHTPWGILLAGGTAVQPTQVENASLIDLAPTILHLLEQPIPPDMDGRVLTELFTPDYLAAHPVHPGTEPARFTPGEKEKTADLTASQEAELTEQLRQLGYVE